MVVVAQLVRAPGCGPGGRRFETDLPPKKPFSNERLFLCQETKIKKQFRFWRFVLIAKRII